MNPSPLLLKAVRESRLDIASEYTALCSELDIQKKIKLSFKQHPFLWLGGAVGAGLLTSLSAFRPVGSRTATPAMPPSPRTEAANSTFTKVGWLAGTLELGKLLYPILRPLALEFLNKAVKRSFSNQGKS